MTDPSARKAKPSNTRRLWPYLLAAAAMALGVLVFVLLAGGGGPRPSPPGVPDAGPVTGWGLPVLRLVADLAAVLTVGMLLSAGVLLPSDHGQLSASGLRCARTAASAAAILAGAAALQLVLTLSDFLAVPLRQALDPVQLASLATQTTEGRALAAQLAFAGIVAVVARWVLTARGAILLLLVALAAVAPPALAGHSAGSTDHMLEVSSLLLHVVAAALWVGGLAALAVVARRVTGPLPVAVDRFSTLALWCLVAVGVSGVVNAWLRLGRPAALVTTGYGLLVLGKATALAALAVLGRAHRRHAIPTLTGPRPRVAFARLAAVEVTVMVATIALAVGLSRTPAPEPTQPEPSGESPASQLLGYPLPPAPTLGRLLFDARPDGFMLIAMVLAAALYVAAVRVLRSRGDPWPAGRTAAFLGGLAVVAVATSGGLGRYAPVLFSAHMVQHMVLNMVAPLLLVLGSPITLALRALPAARARGENGPREVLIGALHSRPARVLAHPLVAAGIFVASLYGLYFTPLFAAAMRHHWGHLAMQAHFLAAGFLFFWVLIGTDPGPRRPPYLLRVLLLFIVMTFHAFFGVALLSATSVIAADYYTALQRPWGASPLEDQRLAGGIGWAFGEVPVMLVLAALFLQWVRADQRVARAADRAAERAERSARTTSEGPRLDSGNGTGSDDRGGDTDELIAYNAWLAALHRRAREGGRGHRNT